MTIVGAGAPIIEFDHHSSEIADKWNKFTIATGGQAYPGVGHEMR